MFRANTLFTVDYKILAVFPHVVHYILVVYFRPNSLCLLLPYSYIAPDLSPLPSGNP